MKPEKLIAKIQEFLDSSSGDPRLARVLSVRIGALFVESFDALQKCLKLARAGSVNAAVETAQEAGLTEAVAALNSPVAKQWAIYCRKNALISVPPFDAEDLRGLSAIYSGKVEADHPLYRRYRRNMRMRDFVSALSTIRCIAKINTSEKVSRELARRVESVRMQMRQKLARILADADFSAPELMQICEFLEENPSEQTNADLESAKKLIAENSVEIRRALLRNIGAKIEGASRIENPADLLQIACEIYDNNLGELGGKEAESASAFCNEAFEKLEARVRGVLMRISAEALSRELESSAKLPGKERLGLLKKFKGDYYCCLDGDSRKILDGKIGALSRRIVLKGAFKFCACAALVAVVCYAGMRGYERWRISDESARALEALGRLTLVDDCQAIKKALDDIERDYPAALKDPGVYAKFSQMRKDAIVVDSAQSRLLGLFDSATKCASLESARISKMIDDMDAAEMEILTLPPSIQTRLNEKLAGAKTALKGEFEKRELEASQSRRRLLEDYEKLLVRYENFERPRKDIDAKYSALARRISDSMADKTFKPHQIDIDRYNDISMRLADARKIYYEFEDARKSLENARSMSEYMAMASLLKSARRIPSDFYKKLSKILSQQKRIKAGQLADFADIDAAEYADKVSQFSRFDLRLPEVLADAYLFTRPNGEKIYAAGPAHTRVNSWDSGTETMQRIQRITPAGTLTTNLFRRHEIFGEDPTGEILGGGDLSPESELARKVSEIAAKKSLLEALEEIPQAQVNPLFKLLLEKEIFDQMRKYPVYSGLMFSKSALKREELVQKHARGFARQSWIFESKDTADSINKALYTVQRPQYKQESLSCIRAIIESKKHPIFMVGVADEQGKIVFFKEPGGRLWAVRASGAFGPVGAQPKSVAPLSPVFSEAVSTADIIKRSKSPGK